jgi:hypothetical protein
MQFTIEGGIFHGGIDLAGAHGVLLWIEAIFGKGAFVAKYMKVRLVDR